jgi:hypothetical protein
MLPQRTRQDFFFRWATGVCRGGEARKSVLYFARKMWPELLLFLPGPPLE